ncbi:hypothetical protein MKL74_12565 [Brucella abortus]|nr:hypothetical protein [Brucella abortus]
MIGDLLGCGNTAILSLRLNRNRRESSPRNADAQYSHSQHGRDTSSFCERGKTGEQHRQTFSFHHSV